MVRWENDNRWRDGITSYIKMKMEINNENSRKCSGRPSTVFSVKKTAEAVGGSDARKCGSAEGGRKTVPLHTWSSDAHCIRSRSTVHCRIHFGSLSVAVKGKTTGPIFCRWQSSSITTMSTLPPSKHPSLSTVVNIHGWALSRNRPPG